MGDSKRATGAITDDRVGSGAARYVGTRVQRVEDGRLLNGTGTFVDDVIRPGMLHACFVRSPMARARIVRVDITEALMLPGVRAVFTAADLNSDVVESWYSVSGPNVPDTPRPPLAEGEVRFAGDPVALVVAESRYLAEDAVELVDVEYESLRALADYTAAVGDDQLVHAGHPGNLAGELPGAPDALEEVFASAAHVVSRAVHQQSYTAAPIETRGLVVEWVKGSGELTIWAATQAPHEVRAFCARLLGLPEQRVRVVARDTGGGFGQKVVPQREDMCLMLAARKVPAPVKWIEDRRENLMSSQARREHGVARVALDDDARILAVALDHVQDVGAYPTPSPLVAAMAVGTLFPGPYRVPKATFSTQLAFSNTPGRVAYRGPWQFESVARELLLDIAARRIGIDPIELRRRNLLRADEMPFTNPNGMPYDHISPSATFEQALSMLDYDAFRREQEAARAAGRFLGIGTSTYVEPTTSAMGMYATEGAVLRMEPSGKVNVYVAGGSTGNSLETAVVQLTADALGLAIEDVGTIQGDTAVTPYGGGTGGSRSGSMLAGAVAEAAEILRAQLVAMAAHRLEADPADIELAQSGARVRGAPSAGVTFAELAAVAYFAPHKLPAGMSPSLEATARYRARAPMLWVNAAHACTCAVDVDTGLVTLLRYVVSEDCGPMINPDVVEGQIAGGTVQGIGGALLEDLAHDERGNPLATTLADYLLPTACDVPVIEYGHVETPGPGPGGHKGVGEGGAIGAPPAVANAVNDALSPFGVEITRLPATPSAILTALRER
jgi:carbon-monoxide dehydrogenase large subunit